MSKEHYNGLTPKQAELLALLAEECGEVVQAVTKILRHGLHSKYDNGVSNLEQLEVELGDVHAAQHLLRSRAGITDRTNILNAASKKLAKVSQYLHHIDDES